MRLVLDLQGAQSLSRHRGIGRYSLAMAKAVASGAGSHEVWLSLNGCHIDASAELLRQFDGLVPPERIRFCELPGDIAGADRRHFGRAAAAQIAYGRFLEELGADHVWHSSLFEGWGDDSTAALGGGERDIAQVATLYDLIPLLHPMLYLGNPEYRDWYYRRLALVKRCGLLLAISAATKRDAVEQLDVPGDRIAMIYGAADDAFRARAATHEQWARWRLEHGLEPGFLLYVGGYDAHKNVENLVRGYADLPSALRARHQLVLAGHCPPNAQKHIADLARRCGIAPEWLIFTGATSDYDLVALYSECALFVSPSLYEGLGLPVLEAMACGAPVIASNAASLPEIIGWKDALFDPRSRSALSAKLHLALVDADYRRQLRKHGQRQSASFTWARSARLALNALEEHNERLERRPRSTIRQRPRLLYLSPLPPAHSGIADYSARILRELSAHYEIDLVIDQPQLADSWLRSNFHVRSVAWFMENAEHCERRLYHFGNSPFHAHMFALLQRYPGLVMLHDSWLGAARNWMADQQGDRDLLRRLLYLCHGYAGLIHDQRFGRAATLDTFPLNLDVISHAHGVLVHSHHAIEQTKRYYGAAAAGKLRQVPFPKSRTWGDRGFTRRMLKMATDDFVVCSFGMLAPTKLNHRLLQAWLASPLASDPRCRLIFVGENHGGDYGQSLLTQIARSGNPRISITGFISAESYADYLAVSDVAVQLRTHSRGETSAAIFDVLAQGLPLVANAHGSAMELPEGTTWLLPDAFGDEELVEALARLRDEPALRQSLGRVAAQWTERQHHPAKVAADYAEAIEEVVARAPGAGAERLRVQLIRGATPLQTEEISQELARLRERTLPELGRRRIYVDVTAIAYSGLHTGIERVVRGVLLELLELQQEQWRIEPVRLDGDRYVYATDYTLAVLGYSPLTLPEIEVAPVRGDILLGLDWVADRLPANRLLLDAWRAVGVRMVFVVYDLLPVRHPYWFPPGISKMHADWLACIGAYGDGLICISHAVADDLRDWYMQHSPRLNRRAVPLGYFHPGSDLASTKPSRGLPENADSVLHELSKRRFFLMVGTLEPRKGHALVIDAFERLWAHGDGAGLLIVGRQGWMSEAAASRIRQHAEYGSRLVWLEQVSDEYLELIYDRANALIAASEGEGFGLPLVEAARRGLPVIARDIPVFREVSSAFAHYFDGADLDGLIRLLRQLANEHAAKPPHLSIVQRPGDWKSATQRLWSMLIDEPAAPWLDA